ncbi:hypothetical protein LCGC14_2185360 [marine sediment metagenome]|uniref:Uncharacterized protein n=1 Tax=marine sediment metagenome TaxID=412755 RepID=A0A0F9E861_9ZZZZ
MYECRKCANRFIEPETVNHRFDSNHYNEYHICPLCKSKDFVGVLCAYCDFYLSRPMPCINGHKTITPFNVSCGSWSIRSKSKPTVV